MGSGLYLAWDRIAERCLEILMAVHAQCDPIHRYPTERSSTTTFKCLHKLHKLYTFSMNKWVMISW